MNSTTGQPQLTSKASRFISNTSRARRLCLQVRASVHARWCLDARYGCKQDATELLQQWVCTVGKQAGLTPHNTRLFSGALGAPESRLEMEVTFDSMAQWESFLAAIPFAPHKAWTQRMQAVVVDGSPVWHVYRSVPLDATVDWQTTQAHEAGTSYMLQGKDSGVLGFSPGAELAGGALDATNPSQQPLGKQLVITDEISIEDIATWNSLKSKGAEQQNQQQQQQHREPVTASPSTPAASDADDKVPRDWKGDPMKINPGDKLPFKFL